MQEIYDIPLHDIKSNVDIEEYSLYYLIGLNVLLVLLIMAGLYLLVRWIKHKKQVTLRKQHAKELKNLDLTHTKDAAYALSFYGATFKEDTPRHKNPTKSSLMHLSPTSTRGRSQRLTRRHSILLSSIEE